MPQIRPITDLRNTNEISDICHAKMEPVFITKNGYGDLVVMSVETYEQTLEVNETDTGIAEAELENANLIDTKEALLSWLGTRGQVHCPTLVCKSINSGTVLELNCVI